MLVFRVNCFKLLPAIAVVALLAAGNAGAFAAPESFSSQKHAVLLYDGKLPAQVELEAQVREALSFYEADVALVTMHAGRAETVPFLRRHGFTRKNAPLFIILDEPGEKERILRRVRLSREGDREADIRAVLAVLKLKEKAPVWGTAAVSISPDGGAAEKKLLVMAAGPQRVVNGGRVLGPGAVVVYRLRLPAVVRYADLTGRLAGNYVVEVSEGKTGPWVPVMESYRYFAGLAGSLDRETKPVADLARILKTLPGDLYLRIHTDGRGTDTLTLHSLEVIARAPGQPSGESEWLAAAAEIVNERRSEFGVAVAKATPLAGVISDTILKANKSPYLMTADVTVSPGRTLTIEPGVAVRVMGRSAIRVLGQLIAKGTPEKPILLAPASPDGREIWRGIEFIPLPNAPSGAQSVITHCKIQNASAVTLANFSGEISHSVFQNCQTGVLLKDGGAGRVRNNRFTGCGRGLIVEGGAGDVAYNEWTDCEIAVTLSSLHPDLPFKFERNSISSSRVAAVSYLKHPAKTLPALSLAYNHWAVQPAQRMLAGGDSAAPVSFEPKLETPPCRPGACCPAVNHIRRLRMMTRPGYE